MSTTVVCRMNAWCDNYYLGYLKFMYDVHEPYSVVMIDTLEDNPWTFSRELIYRSFAEHTGLGDVRMWTLKNKFYIVLDAPDESMTITLDKLEMKKFITETLDLVPLGTESLHMNIDELLEKLLA